MCTPRIADYCIACVLIAFYSAITLAEDTSTAMIRGNLLAPQAFRAAAAKVRPSIVSIETFGGISGIEKTKGRSFKAGSGPTTGLILSDDGYIVTSTFNFLDQPPVITVILANGERHVAKLLGRDDTRKICLLKIDNVKNLPVPVWGKRDEVRVGQWSVALGVGFGETEPSLSTGIISATSRVSGKAVQTDANLSPANYGGPIINLAGEIVGICVPMNPGSRETAAGAEWYDSGIGFAVPFSQQDIHFSALKNGQHLKHGYLGVQLQPYGSPPTGAQVKHVVPKFAGDAAGLKPEDAILEVAGTPVIDVTHLSSLLGRHYLGEKVALLVKRDNEKITLNVTLGEMPPPPTPPAEQKGKAKDSGEKEKEKTPPDNKQPMPEKPAETPAEENPTQ